MNKAERIRLVDATHPPGPSPRKEICGIEVLLSEQEAIEALGLHGRRNPGGALRHLVRMRRLRALKHGRGMLAFTQGEIQRYLAELSRKAED